MQTSFAYYRLPYADHYHRIVSDEAPLVLNSLEDIDGREGFVIAPFVASVECPVVIIRTSDAEVSAIDVQRCLMPLPHEEEENVRENYPFEPFHDAVASGEFHKLVLARKKRVECDVPLLTLFERACQQYPRLMVMLFSTPVTGTWLMATPEILLETKHNTVQTMALAGTMPYSEGYAEWSEKNKTEQHVVEKYIEDTIAPFATNIIKDGPYTARAGNLQHLRTDFRFQMHEPLGRLIARLHPTPAVCGQPKHDARQFILQHEGINRRYYSGFAGPLNVQGESHLYVSLRCAELFCDHAELYAGGGIMPDSQRDAEWQETESKMNTIANVLK